MRVLPCIHNPVALWAAYCIARHKRAKCGALHMARVITLANFEGVPLYPVYTIQPVVKPVINRFDNRVERTAAVRSTVLNEQSLFVRSTGCQTGLYNRSYTIQPVVKPVQPVECLYT